MGHGVSANSVVKAGPGGAVRVWFRPMNLNNSSKGAVPHRVISQDKAVLSRADSFAEDLRPK